MKCMKNMKKNSVGTAHPTWLKLARAGEQVKVETSFAPSGLVMPGVRFPGAYAPGYALLRPFGPLSGNGALKCNIHTSMPS